MEDAKDIVDKRFPCPEILQTFPGDGSERWIKCVLNPSNTRSTTDIQNNETLESGNFLTDDASLKVFMDYLKKLVVSTPK